MASRYNQAYVERMQKRAVRAVQAAKITEINSKLIKEQDPVKRAKLNAERAVARAGLAQARVRKGKSGGGE